MIASCLYEGTVRHRRVDPPRAFRDRLALAYIDLEELPRLLGGRLISRRPGVIRFRRADYLGDPGQPLDQAVRDAVQAQSGRRPAGPVRVLTQLRSFGHCFNPVSFYYCLDGDGERVEALLAEVTNTPWGERHAYTVSAGERDDVIADGGGDRGSRVLDGRFAKALHVSPFIGMDHTYACRASTPGATLAVHIESQRAGTRVFDATLALRRRELTRSSLRGMAARYPLATVRVLALIYLHALGLRLAGAPVFRHPRRADA